MKTAALAAIAAASMLVSAPRVFSQDNEPKSAADATRFPAATPEERADRYLKWCLAPRIADVSENLSEKERADLAEKSKVWSEQLRNAIIDFERVEVTPEGVVEEIKTGANSDQFSDQLVEYFRERLSFMDTKTMSLMARSSLKPTLTQQTFTIHCGMGVLVVERLVQIEAKSIYLKLYNLYRSEFTLNCRLES